MAKIELSDKEAKEFLRNYKKPSIVKGDSQVKNKLTDLNNYLFEELERLNDESLSEEDMNKEIERARAITSVAHAVIDNAQTILKSVETLSEYGYAVDDKQTLCLLGLDTHENT